MTLDSKEWKETRAELDSVARIDRSYPDRIAAEIVDNKIKHQGEF